MKKLTKIISMILLSATVLTGCGNAATLSINEAAVMTPVDSFYTDEVREYTDEGTIEEPEMIISSDDGLCVIRKMPSYFDITLDYEKGDRASVGRAYGTLIREKLPDFVPMFEPYIY